VQADACGQMSMPPVFVFIIVSIPLAYASLDLAEIHSKAVYFQEVFLHTNWVKWY